MTGAGSGIGRACCQQLLKLGACVYATDVSQQSLDEAFGSESSDRVRTMRLDVTSDEQVQALAKRIAADGVALFGVINSAGVATPPGRRRHEVVGATELDLVRDVQPVFDINVFGTMRVNSALFDALWSNRDASPAIVNIASCAGRGGFPGMSVYCATKHAVVGYTESMRRELACENIRVFSIEPG